MSKAWLIGFTEAEGSFYFVNKSKDRLIHGFEITQKLDLIVLTAIGCILGIKTTSKKTYNTVVTTNSRSIENIINYYNNTMKGIKSFEFRVWARCYVKHKGDFTKLNDIRNKIRSKRLGTTIFNVQNTRLIHTSSVNYQNLSLFIDNTNEKSIIERKNGIYKVYDNLFLNTGNVPNKYETTTLIDKFTLNLIEILEDLYDNNETTVFYLYFIIKPDYDFVIKFDIVKLNQHFAKYPLEFIDQNIVKFYKNTGLLTAVGIFVFYSLYDINNLTNISSNIKKDIIDNIDIINKNVHKDLNNTIINYTKQFDINSEIILIIHADFDRIEPIKR
jgi:hypothetical protein